MNSAITRPRRPVLSAAFTAVAAGLFVGCVVAAMAAALCLPVAGLFSKHPGNTWPGVAGLTAGLTAGVAFGRRAYGVELDLAATQAGACDPNPTPPSETERTA